MSEDSGYPGAPPGWYADPSGGPGQRWWDGYAWSDATVLPDPLGPPSQVAPWAAASPRLNTLNTGSLVDGELGMVSVARVAVVLPAVYYLVDLIMQRENADQLLSLGHQFRVIWHDTQNHVTPPPYHGPSGYSPITLLVGVVALAGVVFACIWQHRAASAARALKVPSHHSPGWGVGAWFVPVVNLWVPYAAIRDCLPADDPHRPRVLAWWVAWLVAVTATLTATVCALFSSGAALVLSIPAALACLAVIAWAPGIVTAIAAAHRDLLARQGQAVAVLPR